MASIVGSRRTVGAGARRQIGRRRSVEGRCVSAECDTAAGGCQQQHAHSRSRVHRTRPAAAPMSATAAVIICAQRGRRILTPVLVITMPATWYVHTVFAVMPEPRMRETARCLLGLAK